VPDVVVALAAQRLSELDIGARVPAIASRRLSVSAFAVAGASPVTATSVANGVDGTEAGRGEGDEQLGVIGHGGGDVVVSALQTGVDELPGVPGVQIRARRAYRGASVVAAGEYLVFAAEFVAAGQVDRVGAEPHRLHALPPGVESRRAGTPDYLGDHGVVVGAVGQARQLERRVHRLLPLGPGSTLDLGAYLRSVTEVVTGTRMSAAISRAR
jgi:hypothetical protein